MKDLSQVPGMVLGELVYEPSCIDGMGDADDGERSAGNIGEPVSSDGQHFNWELLDNETFMFQSGQRGYQ
jgi:hypothetical protein